MSEPLCWFSEKKETFQIGLYSKVVTYFFLYRCVALSTITPSWRKQKAQQEEAEDSARTLISDFPTLTFTWWHRATFKPQNEYYHCDTHCSLCLLTAGLIHISYLMKICHCQRFVFPPSSPQQRGGWNGSESCPDMFELAWTLTLMERA